MKKTIILLTLLLFLCVSAWGVPTEVPKTVDPDNGGGTDYTSLDAWEDALGGTTTGHLPNDDQIAIAECRSSGGTDDTAIVNIVGWTTDSTRYILITGSPDYGDGDGDFPADGIYDDTKYVLKATNDTIVDDDEDYTIFDHIQFEVTQTDANSAYGLYTSTSTNGANLRIVSNCIFKGVCSGTGVAVGYYCTNGFAVVRVWNCIAYGFYIASDTGFEGFLAYCSTCDFYNCVSNTNTNGFRRSGGTVTVANGLSFENEDDFVGTMTITYCASDDDHTGDSATNIIIGAAPDQSGDDYAALVVDADGGNYAVTDASSKLYQTGNGGDAKAFFTDDIIGATRDGVDLNWDIGAFEYVAPAAGAGQVIFIN